MEKSKPIDERIVEEFRARKKRQRFLTFFIISIFYIGVILQIHPTLKSFFLI